MRMLFYLGAALAFIGLGVIVMGYNLAGALILIAGISLIVISFTILKFHGTMNLKRR